MADLDRGRAGDCSWCWWYSPGPRQPDRYGACMRQSDAMHVHWVHEMHPPCRHYTETRPKGLKYPRSENPWQE